MVMGVWTSPHSHIQYGFRQWTEKYNYDDEVCIYVDYSHHLGPCAEERILRLISKCVPPAAKILSVAN